MKLAAGRHLWHVVSIRRLATASGASHSSATAEQSALSKPTDSQKGNTRRRQKRSNDNSVQFHPHWHEEAAKFERLTRSEQFAWMREAFRMDELLITILCVSPVLLSAKLLS